MHQQNRQIIADGPTPPSTWRLFAAVFVSAALLGTLAALHYASQDLTLSHYDARGHLLVARRVTDSLTPGWRQLGAVWLPLPHLLSALPLLSNWAFQTGYPVVGISIVSLATGLALVATYIRRATGSLVAAWVAPALVLLNPNILYLQSTPMTEPLLLGLSLVALVAVDAWVCGRLTTPLWPGIAIVLLAWTRYEGWLVSGALVGGAALLRWRSGGTRPWALLPYLVGALVGFLLLGRGATGAWFVTSGFFVPEPSTLHHPLVVLRLVLNGSGDLASPVTLAAGVAGAGALLVAARRRPGTLLALALVAAAGLPCYAFYEGHPFRVRYLVPLVAASGILAAFAVAALPRRLHVLVSLTFVGIAALQRPPLDARAAMVTEAQWERPFRLERMRISAYLAAAYDGTPILASMGSLGHYMQESSAQGLRLRDFLHEGNGDLWQAAVRAPQRHVNWILLEERAEGGDDLFQRSVRTPGFLGGFTRIVAAGGAVLYKRDDAIPGIGPSGIRTARETRRSMRPR